MSLFVSACPSTTTFPNCSYFNRICILFIPSLFPAHVHGNSFPFFSVSCIFQKSLSQAYRISLHKQMGNLGNSFSAFPSAANRLSFHSPAFFSSFSPSLPTDPVWMLIKILGKVYPLSSTKSLCIGQYCHIYMDSAAYSS